MRYSLELTGTAATIGYCACSPEGDLTLADAVRYLEDHPCDEFMHKHLLRQVLAMSLNDAKAFAADFGSVPTAAAILAEAALQRDDLAGLVTDGASPSATPLVDLRQELFPDMALHRAWSRLFADNLLDHAPLPDLEACPEMPWPLEIVSQAGDNFAPVAEFVGKGRKAKGGSSPQEATRRAEAALAAAGVRISQQMMHQSSLAPVGLVRKWRIEVPVRSGALDYVLGGEQTSFGRGLEFEPAQAALLMEMCERYSSWAAIAPDGARGYARPLPLVQGRYSELGAEALNPGSLPLEVPDADVPLFWVPGERPDGSAVLVPAQFVFLFANLDEPALCSGLGSTGLGAGLDRARARTTALLEVVERDAESVAPHSLSRCFKIASRDKALAALLGEYEKRGIDVFFENITSELGVPCYRAFAVGPEGQVMKGASAGLNGPEACVSAMLEVPYPYPWGPPSRPAPQGLPVRVVEDLPNYSTGNYPGDLAVLEAALAASGRAPAYVDLTREDMGIPVCRAVVPGLELMADFDRHSRLSPRLFAAMLRDAERSAG